MGKVMFTPSPGAVAELEDKIEKINADLAGGMLSFSIEDGILYATAIINDVVYKKKIKNMIHNIVALIPALTADTANVSASSVYSGRNAYKAFDNDDSTYWSGATGATESYITYAFDDEVVISKLHLVTTGNDNSTACTFYIETSTDGSTYKTIWSYIIGATTVYDADIELEEEVFAKYLRFRMTGVKQTDISGAALSTLQAYGYVNS